MLEDKITEFKREEMDDIKYVVIDFSKEGTGTCWFKEEKMGLSSKLCKFFWVCQVNCVSFFLKIFERGDFYSLSR